MTLWEELARLNSETDSPLYGVEPQYVCVMFSALANLHNMRFTHDGRPKNKTQTREVEKNFCESYNMTKEQYKCITGLFDKGRVGNVHMAYQASLDSPGVVRQYFDCDKTTCCGRTLQVRYVMATVYTRNDCFQTKHAAKSCRAGCGANYYLNKCVIAGFVGDKACTCHLFYPWSDGQIPRYITSKSGKSIFCTDYLTDVAIIQAKTRCESHCLVV